MTDALKKRAYEGLKSCVDASTVAVSENIKKYGEQIKSTAKILELNNSDASLNDKYCFLSKNKIYNDMEKLFYVTNDGTAYECVEDGEALPKVNYDFSNRAFFQNALKGGVYISNPFITESIEGYVVAISSPVLNESKKVTGVIVGFYKGNILDDVFKNTITSRNYVAYIVNSENSIIAKTDNFDLGVEIGEAIPIEDTDYTSIKDFHESFESANFGYGDIALSNMKYISVFRTLNKSDWTLVVAMPVINVTQGYLTIIYGTILVVLIGTAIIIYIAGRFFSKDNDYRTLMRTSNMFKETSEQVYIILRRDGLIISANKRFLKDTGYSSYELENHSIYDFIEENYANDFRTYLYKASTGADTGEFEIPVKGKVKAIYYLWSAKINKMIGINKLQLVATNVDRYKEAEEKMNRLVYFDSLTGYRNGVWLENHFNEITKEGTNNPIAVIYIDIDNFKYVNDMFGHHIGDRIIIEMCRRVDRIINDSATICRRGGDEICIIVEDVQDQDMLKEYLNDVVKVIGEEYVINSVKHTVTASMGVAIYPKDGQCYSDIFTCADIAMNNAKENGKNSVVFFENEMQETMREIITMEKDLKSAVENNEFVLYYQPQYNMETGKLYGFEALLRWISPTKGFISPAKFISHAERTQMIVPMGDWILDEACSFANEAIEMGRDDICISVNVSVVQMLSVDYTERTLEIIKKNKTNPKNIKLEITESVFMETIDDMIKKIKVLNNKGLYFALDDFGTGYSSLNYLKKIPIKVLKIDKSFVDMIADESDNKDIITSIINLAHDMNLDVVAEGIEDKEQLAWLKSKGCNIAQGYLTGKPMPREEALKELYRNIYEDKNEKEA